MVLSFVRSTLLVGVLLCTGAIPLYAEGGWTDADVSAALTQASQKTGVSRSLLRCLSWYESEWHPYAVGRRGELGLFQLLPRRGLLPDFYAAGYTNPFNPYQSSLFAAEMIDAGYGYFWSTWELC